MKRSISLICIALMLSIIVQSCKKKQLPPHVTVTVAGLFSITGNWSSLGINSKAAEEIAANDINEYLANKGSYLRVATKFYDTELDTVNAKNDFRDANNKGTHFIIGPQSSAELAAIRPLADAAQIIVISQSSTAGSLAIAGDPIYRFCPADAVEGKAMAAKITADNIHGLVTVARNDAGNLGLQTAVGTNFTAAGGKVSALTPYATTTTDFSSVIAALRVQVGTFAATYGTQYTAVYVASFDEGVQLLKQAANDPILIHVKWYGGDGLALSDVLTSDATASGFATTIGFTAPTFGLPIALNSKWLPISQRIQAKTGIAPDAFALSVYDAMWVIVLAVESENNSDIPFKTLQTLFVNKCKTYNGITGSTALNSAGDRANGDYDFWNITKTDNGYKWNFVSESGN